MVLVFSVVRQSGSVRVHLESGKVGVRWGSEQQWWVGIGSAFKLELGEICGF